MNISFVFAAAGDSLKGFLTEVTLQRATCFGEMRFTTTLAYTRCLRLTCQVVHVGWVAPIFLVIMVSIK